MANAKTRWGALVLGVAAASAAVGTLRAASTPPVSADPMDAKTQMFLSQCRAEFNQVDASIEKAGTRFREYHLVPGFPYMRSDRLLASFGDQVGNSDVLDAWTLELRDNDGFAREIELANMGMPRQQRAALLNDLRLCAVWLSNIELTNRATLDRLVQAARPPEKAPRDAAVTAKLDSETARRQALLKADFERPLAQLGGDSQLVQWQAKKAADDSAVPTDWSRAVHDGLGRVGLTPDSWRALAERNAPRWLIETSGAYDTLGTPVMGKDGVQVDTSHATVYYQAGYARINGRAAIQMDYFVWFSARHGVGASDADAGPLDGLIWRVTLDAEGKPAFYDAIHMSGFDQMWFMPASFVQKPAAPDEDPVLVAQRVVPTLAPSVRLHTGSHTPRRVLAASEAGAPATKEYDLVEYEYLMTLPTEGGGTRSVFDAQGVVPGTERANALYQSTGVPHAGALRVWGTHPTSLAARHFFDDPYLVDKLFILAGKNNSAADGHMRLAGRP